jgi:YVTN family beta-propeller protein
VTSPTPDGKLVVVDIATRQVVHEIALGGQPDSIAISKDGKYVAVVIENERDEDARRRYAPPSCPAASW